MMMSGHGIAFPITGALSLVIAGFPSKRASDKEIDVFCYKPEQAIGQTGELSVIGDELTLI